RRDRHDRLERRDAELEIAGLLVETAERRPLEHATGGLRPDRLAVRDGVGQAVRAAEDVDELRDQIDGHAAVARREADRTAQLARGFVGATEPRERFAAARDGLDAARW